MELGKKTKGKRRKPLVKPAENTQKMIVATPTIYAILKKRK